MIVADLFTRSKAYAEEAITRLGLTAEAREVDVEITFPEDEPEFIREPIMLGRKANKTLLGVDTVYKVNE